ncbi:MAG: hypothetical protein ACJA1V_000655, partial [Flavobacteriaceae bacterium]
MRILLFNTHLVSLKPILFGLFCFGLLQTQIVFAQNIKLPFSPLDTISILDSTLLKPRGGMLLPIPENLKPTYKYNLTLDLYERVGGLSGYDFKHPLILSPKEYWDRMKNEEIQSYFKEKSAAILAKDQSSKSSIKNLLPSFSLQNDVLKTIFGGDDISFDAQGSVGVDMGILWQKNDNPALSPRNRTNLSFDFEQQISLSLLGKIGERLSVNASYDTQATFDFQNLIKIAYTPPTVKDISEVSPNELLDNAKQSIGNSRLGPLAQDLNNQGLLQDSSQENILNAAKNQFFNPNADNILKNIEIGNVNMPLNSSLITGAQSLFGVKTQLQFGRTQITAVLSEQRSQNNSVMARGGGTISDFSVTALDYEEDRHFFLSHFFRDQYDRAMAAYPFVNSQVQITRIEVWVTNRIQQTQNIRNIVALQDLGEAQLENTRLGRSGVSANSFITNTSGTFLPSNEA